MNNDFKKSSYLLTVILFLIGIVALVGVSAAKFFSFDELVVSVSQIVSLVSFFAIFISCIYSKSKYNTACIRFADYILSVHRKEDERKAADAERVKEIQNIRQAAEHDREKAVAAALQQGRSEGAQSAGAMPVSQRVPVQSQTQAHPQSQTQAPAPQPQYPVQQPFQAGQPYPVQQSYQIPQRVPQIPVVSQGMAAPQNSVMPQQNPMMSQPVQMPAARQTAPVSAPAPQRMPEAPAGFRERREPSVAPNEEMLYNEYGEPVMIRRRVRKTADSAEGEMLYDGNGNPVVRRTQGLWEPLEQRHEIVLKVETAPGVSVSQSGRFNPNDRQDNGQ